MIVLRSVPKDAYKEISQCLDEQLQALPPKILSLNLENFFSNIDTAIDVRAWATAESIVDEYIDYYELCFSVKCQCSNDDYQKLSHAVRHETLNKKTQKRSINYYRDIHDCYPDLSASVFDCFSDDKEIFEFLTGYYFDFRYRYYRSNQNALDSHDVYSGVFRGQGLLTYFFESLQKVIDFNDLDYLEIEDIVERNTCRMFNPLRRKIPSDSYLALMLKRKYVKSPFLRLFKNIGFSDIEIQTNEGYICAIRARKSDNLSFRVSEDE